ncbi:DinB family protein [Pontibacillus sp. HMF3514]|uniref:DinB family protein n=1 Tax=Pontibacillus sp. HMF3514 TaxID=2692425 RepID=UPI00131F65A6|nr:DinB family protein [Pontibacillus sp. HMF3514]QHE52822.1 DinB family protein [Pontibacillus sp. HMF3514]
MNKFKKVIINHHLESIQFVKSLDCLSEKEWRTQIEDNKWTIAEIIGHFKPWDEFVIHKRLPYLFSDSALPKGPNSENLNTESASISREQSKEATINEFISIREKLYKAINIIPDQQWEKKFSIGETELSLYEYLNGLAKHDIHHFEQIKKVLNRNDKMFERKQQT